MNSIIEDKAADENFRNEIWEAVGAVKHNFTDKKVIDWNGLYAKVYSHEDVIRVDIGIDMERMEE